MVLPFFIVVLVLALVGFPIWAIVRILDLSRAQKEAELQLSVLEQELAALRREMRPPAPATTPPPAAPVPAERLSASAPISPPPPAPAPLVTVSHVTAPAQPPAVAPLAGSASPAIPAPAAPPPAVAVPPALAVVAVPPPAIPPARSTAEPPLLPTAARSAGAPPVVRSRAPLPRIDWEQFMGAKLFAWLGGLAALLGVGFFVKYSFDHDIVPPEVRVALGYVFAISLVAGGLKLSRSRYGITAQTLIATGIVSLYAVTFACNSVYRFAWFGQAAAFAVMSLVTVAAFLLAVRLEARVIAVLGILGGFLTPVLLSTGEDNPAGLFGYVALLDAGLLAVALHRRWNFLIPLGAAGTVLMQWAWAGQFLRAANAGTGMLVCLAFCALFLAACFAVRRRPGAEELPLVLVDTASVFPAVALLFALRFLRLPAVAAQPGLLFGFVFLADAVLLALVWLEPRRERLHWVAGSAVFAFLALWTAGSLTDALLPWALAGYLLHAILHTAFPLVLGRRRPVAGPAWWQQVFPAAGLLLMLLPLVKLSAVSLSFWPAVLLIDLLAIGVAVWTGSLVAVAAVLALTMVAAALWILQVPVAGGMEPELLVVIGGFALLFFGAGIYLLRRLGPAPAGAPVGPGGVLGDPRTQLPALSTLLPFALLILMSQRLALTDPSPLCGLALLLVLLALGLARVFVVEWLPACALAGVTALEFAWRARHPEPAAPGLWLGWLLLFHGVFATYPFLFRARFAGLTGPWAVAALSGIAPTPIILRLVAHSWPNHVMGLVPAGLAVPPLLALAALRRAPAADERARLNQFAWYGGAALFFVTLVFPVQFERQWITLGWALEGVALLWLFHRVPHPGLRGTGTVLLLAACARLALNPAVLAYHARAELPILNWYLYSYGVVIAALFVGARLLAPPRERVFDLDFPPILRGLGTVLGFLLLNLEIADFFSTPGQRVLTFQFSGHFGRDMTYTIAWALFALGLLLFSLWRGVRPGRYAAIALLGVALVKLFLHDLARLEALYRVGALFAVATIAIVASVAYQRFLPNRAKNSGADQP